MVKSKTSKAPLKMKNPKLKVIGEPVVKEEKSMNFKNIFGMFSQFVAIGGDFV